MVARLVVELRKMKTAAKIVGGVILVAVLAWTGTLLYWHFTLRSAIEAQGGPNQMAARVTLRSAGCRSLPYVIRSLDRDPKSSWQWEFLYRLLLSTSTQEDFPADLETGEILNFLEGCFVDPEPTPAKEAAWRKKVQAWWEDSGSGYHQWWRVWSSSCRLGTRRPFRE